MKQVMKRAILAFVGVVMIGFIHAATIVTVGGLEYTLSGAYASVYGVADNNTARTITIPSSIEYNNQSYNVVSLSDACFCNYYVNYMGKRFSVIDGVTYEGAPYCYYAELPDADRRAHNCSYVRNVILPNTITSIGAYSFSNANLTSIKLKEGVTTIGELAFYLTSITSIVVPSTVQTFKEPSKLDGTFSDCDMLRTILYLGNTPPSGWTATSATYVPNKTLYGTPYKSINNANVIEMVSFTEHIFPYTGKAPTPSWTNNMEGYSVSLSVPTLKKDVGSYEEIIPATITKDGESYIAQIPYKYTIEPVKLTAKANNTSRTYGEPNPSFNITITGFVNWDDESVLTTIPTATTTATPSSAVGKYPITVSGGAAKNYKIEYEQGELTVNKASLSIQVKDSQKVYGSDNPAFSLNYSGLKNNETVPEWTTAPQFSTTAKKESGVGTYTVGVYCAPKNYNITSNTSGKLTITKAPLTIMVENATMDYCGTMPTYRFVYSGFVNNDNPSSLSTQPSVSTTATAKSNAGTYTITPTGAGSPNYDFTYTPGTLTIKKRPLTVKALSASRLYGENNPTFTINYEGFVNGETKSVLEIEPTATTTATTQSNAGTYDIRVSGGRALNYEMTYMPGQLTITPRALKASVGNYERPYGENNPTFTIVYEGLVGNDTGNSLNPAPIARTSATKTSDVGTYDIEVSGGYSPNYILSYGSGMLVIVKAEQDFEWNQDLSNLKVGDQVALLAHASSGLPVTYTINTEDYAEVYAAGSKTYMECKAPGTFMIKAVQNGNDNYFSTQRINKEVTIVSGDVYNPTLFIKQADNGMVSMKVEKGSSKTFNIYPDTGWKIHSVTFNGVDVTSQLDSNGLYTTPAINENSTLIIIYEQTNNAVNAPLSSTVRILPTAIGIKVTGVSVGDVVKVFTADGVLLKAVKADSTDLDILLNKDKVYLVRVGQTTMKLRL